MTVRHSGQKIMKLPLTDNTITLLYELKSLHLTLSKFPEAFGLHLQNLSKVNFPFNFNIPASQNYVGAI